MSPLRELALLRLRTFLREPEALFWTFGFPILLTVGLGLAFREDSGGPAAQIGIERGSAGERFLPVLGTSAEVRPLVLDSAEAERALRTGAVALLLTGGDTLVFRYDPARPESREARLLTDAVIQASAGAVRPVPVTEDSERVPGSRYVDWLIPGLIGLNLMSSGLWAIGFGIVFMRQKKQLKRLIVTPMRRRDFLFAQILARLAFLLLEIPPIMIFAWLAFDVKIAGSALSLIGVIVLGALTFAGLGLLASSRARTIETVSGLNNVMMLPMFVLSGVFFSSSRFPEVMQPFIRALPLTALNEAMRGIYNEGVSVLAVWPQIAILTAWAVGAFALALKIYRWQ
jgi:ABC-2 type transport system permease protein